MHSCYKSTKKLFIELFIKIGEFYIDLHEEFIDTADWTSDIDEQQRLLDDCHKYLTESHEFIGPIYADLFANCLDQSTFTDALIRTYDSKLVSLEADGKTLWGRIWTSIHQNTANTNCDITLLRNIFGSIALTRVSYHLLGFICHQKKEEKDIEQHKIETIALCDKSLIMVPDKFDLLAELACDIHDSIEILVPDSIVAYDRIIASTRFDVDIQTKELADPIVNSFDTDRHIKLIPRVTAEEALSQSDSFIYGEPIIITNFSTNRPSFSDRKLTLEQIYLSGCHRVVPVEIGQNYTDDQWTQELVTLGFLIHHCIVEPETQLKYYMAMHNLFRQIPKLGDVLCKPNDELKWTLSKSVSRDSELNVWLGPEGTVSSMHWDRKDNVFTQIFGYKLVVLCDKDEDHDTMKPFDNSTHFFNTSSIEPVNSFEGYRASDRQENDEYNCDLSVHPPMHAAIVCPGEILFIPAHWWHYVKALSASLSVSYWW